MTTSHTWEGSGQLLQAAATLNGNQPDDEFDFEPVTAADFYTAPSAPADELLGPLLQRGKRTLISAASGEGKSTFITHAIAAFATGGDFLGFTGAGGRVLWLDAEQDADDIKRLIREAGLTKSLDVDIISDPDGVNLMAGTPGNRAMGRLLERGRYDVVVADPLYKLHEANSNEEQEVIRFTKELDRWRVEHRFALIVQAHNKKPTHGVPPSINDVFGSGAWVRGCEIIVGLQLLSEGASRLHFFKRRGGSNAIPIRGHWDLRFTREAGFTRTTFHGGRDGVWSSLEAIFTKEPGVWWTAGDLSKETGRDISAIRTACKHRASAGLLEEGNARDAGIQKPGKNPVVWRWRPSEEDLMRWKDNT